MPRRAAGLTEAVHHCTPPIKRKTQRTLETPGSQSIWRCPRFFWTLCDAPRPLRYLIRGATKPPGCYTVQLSNAMGCPACHRACSGVLIDSPHVRRHRERGTADRQRRASHARRHIPNLQRTRQRRGVLQVRELSARWRVLGAVVVLACVLPGVLQDQRKRQRRANVCAPSATVCGLWTVRSSFIRVSCRPIVSHSFSPFGGHTFSPEWGPPIFGR